MTTERDRPVADTTGIGTPVILRIVLTYAIFAGLWILLSDKAVDWLLQDRLQLLIVHTLKGWLFVAVTSLLLYGMLRRLTHRGAVDPALPTNRRIWNMPLIIASAAIVTATAIAVAQSLQEQRASELSRLEATSNLKAGEVVHWLEERRGDAEFFRTSSFLADLYQRWQDGNAETGATLQARLAELGRSYHYQGLALSDHDGRLLWSSQGFDANVHYELPAVIDLSRQDGAMHWVLYPKDAQDRHGIAYVVPLAKVAGATPFLVVSIDPGDWIYEALQTWPLPTETGETLLFRRQQDHLEFLNERRFARQAPSSRAKPGAKLIYDRLLSGELPKQLAVSGLGFRGVPVVAVTRPIPGTDWMLVAKIDETEIYQGAIAHSLWIALVGLLVLFATAASGALLRQREQLAMAGTVRKSQEDRLQALQLLSAIADGSSDAIYAKDLQGRYILFNQAAGRFVGQAPDMVLGRDDHAIFPASQAVSLQEFGRRVIAEKRLITMEEHLETVEGPKVFLATKGPLLDTEGNPAGLFGISRDITERKKAEKLLMESERRYRGLFDNAAVAIMTHDAETGEILDANRRAIESYGFDTLEELQHNEFWLEPPFSFEDAVNLIHKAASEGPQRFLWKNCDRHGNTFWEDVLLNRIELNGVVCVLSITIDVTERKKFEDLLRQQVEINRRYLDTVQTLIVALDLQGIITMINRKGCEILGYTELELLGRNWFEICQPQAKSEISAVFRQLVQGDIDAARYIENSVVCRSGEKRLFAWQNAVLTDDSGNITGTLSSGEDITDRRADEEALAQQARELRIRNEELQRFNRVTVGRELTMIALKQEVNELSLQLGKEAPYSLDFLEEAPLPPQGAR